MVDVELLRGLDEAQLAAVTNPTDPVAVLAPAGSGKTRVITRRIAWRAQRGDLDVRRVLAITFTTRAAGELTERLGALLGRDTGTTGTFHAIALRMIRDHRTEHRLAPPVVLEHPRELLDAVIPTRLRGAGAAIATEITWATARGVEPGGYPAASQRHGRRPPVDPDRIAEIFDAYRQRKRRRGVLDFDDLISTCADLLESDPAFRRAQHWRYRHFFVDEYQDVNPAQQRLLEAWLGDRKDLFVVGDPNQAIYGFNGADARFLTGFAERHPGATVLELSTNHRSSAEIVRIAGAALNTGARNGSNGGPATSTLSIWEDEHDEALAIARALRAEHLPGHRWSSQAVLVRTHAQTRPIVEVLERARIPVVTHTGPDDADAVRVATFHSAKGLEWPIVHLAGLEEGLVPDHHARTDAELAEERRLLYVATSRAARRLHLTWARRRTFGTRVLERRPSRWLTGIRAEVAPSSTPRRASLEPAPAAALDPTPGEPESARARLERWRTATARAADVPVEVVITDAALDELIRRAPRDREGLGRVPGIGVSKADHFGTALLEVLHAGGSR